MKNYSPEDLRDALDLMVQAIDVIGDAVARVYRAAKMEARIETCRAVVERDFLTLCVRVVNADGKIGMDEFTVIREVLKRMRNDHFVIKTPTGDVALKNISPEYAAAMWPTVETIFRNSAFDITQPAVLETVKVLRKATFQGFDPLGFLSSAMFRVANLVARADGPVTSEEIAQIKQFLPSAPSIEARQFPSATERNDQSRARPSEDSGGPYNAPAILAKPATEVAGTSKRASAGPRRVTELLNELHDLIGLNGVKESVDDLINFVRIQQAREERGLKANEISLHTIFTGNPGTGKTTVARLLAEIYRELGLLSKGHLVETDRAGLVGGYVGQTAIKVDGIIKSAKGGVLFIDEAYALSRDGGGGNDFGSEAIDTLLKRMEDYRRDLIVIVAGYTDKMNQFVLSNPGLSSRFSRTIHFEDFSSEEMLGIFLLYCKQQDYGLSEDATESLKRILRLAFNRRDETFGNARFVRNLFEDSINNLANRVVSLPEVSREQLMTIEAVDLPGD